MKRRRKLNTIIPKNSNVLLKNGRKTIIIKVEAITGSGCLYETELGIIASGEIEKVL